jgi:excisionase family DNA binding protein
VSMPRREIVLVTRVMTPEQLAARWSVPKSHVYRLTREGRIPVVKLGRYYRYRLDEIERFEIGEKHKQIPEGSQHA